MVNVLKGVYINGQFYNYVTGSWKISVPLKTDINETQGATRNITSLGKAPYIQAINIFLENSYEVYGLSSASFVAPLVGVTQWQGVSRLSYFVNNILDARGSSLPHIFVAPDGTTHNVVITGNADIEFWNPATALDSGTEYRISLTLTNFN